MYFFFCRRHAIVNYEEPGSEGGQLRPRVLTETAVQWTAGGKLGNMPRHLRTTNMASPTAVHSHLFLSVNSSRTWAGPSCTCASWGSWRCCTTPRRSTAATCSGPTTPSSSKSASTCSRTPRNRCPARCSPHTSKNTAVFIQRGYRLFIFSFLPGSFRGQPGRPGGRHGITGYDLWPFGAASRWSETRDRIRVGVSRKLLLQPRVKWLPEPTLLGEH